MLKKKFKNLRNKFDELIIENQLIMNACSFERYMEFVKRWNLVAILMVSLLTFCLMFIGQTASQITNIIIFVYYVSGLMLYLPIIVRTILTKLVNIEQPTAFEKEFRALHAEEIPGSKFFRASQIVISWLEHKRLICIPDFLHPQHRPLLPNFDEAKFNTALQAFVDEKQNAREDTVDPWEPSINTNLALIDFYYYKAAPRLAFQFMSKQIQAETFADIKYLGAAFRHLPDDIVREIAGFLYKKPFSGTDSYKTRMLLKAKYVASDSTSLSPVVIISRPLL